MKCFKALLTVGLLAAATLGFARPQELVTHNTTDVWSNAKVGGMFSPHPTKPHSDNHVSWWEVRLACFGHTSGNNCPAEIYVDSQGANPINMGKVTLNLETGEITPNRLEKDGYVIEVVGLAETRITKQ